MKIVMMLFCHIGPPGPPGPPGQPGQDGGTAVLASNIVPGAVTFADKAAMLKVRTR